MLLVAGCCEKWTHTHTISQFVSVNVANHPHILVLPRRELPEDKQQLLSHHLTLFIPITLPLCLPLSPYHPLIPSSPFPMPPLPLGFIATVLSSPAPIFPQSTLSLPGQCCIDFHKASPVISPYLLIPTLSRSFSTLQVCFLSHTHIQSLPVTCCLCPPDMVIINLIFYYCDQSPKMGCDLHLLCIPLTLESFRTTFQPGFCQTSLTSAPAACYGFWTRPYVCVCHPGTA